MKAKHSSSRFLWILTPFQRAPGVVLRLLFLLAVLWGTLLGLWALGLIGEGGRDTIEPQRTVRLNQASVTVLQSFLGGRQERIETIVVDRYPDPFR